MKKDILIPLLLIIFITLCVTGCKRNIKNPVDYVDPIIGTDAFGHTFPGATWPFGMIQLSPDTRLEGWNGCSGYHYSDEVVFGFSHTHLSGTGCLDYGDILLMPTTGTLQLNNGAKNHTQGYASKFSHKNEEAAAGYYSVMLDDYNVKVELTATPRVGWHKYHFPKTENAHVVLDLMHRDKVLESHLEFVGKNEITGYRRSQEWANDQRTYFVIQFSRDFERHGVEVSGEKHEGTIYASGEALKAWADFDMSTDNTPLLVKVALSPVSVENARLNLETEAPDWDFDAAHANVRKVWNEYLSRIVVEGDSKDDKINFYTAMYHCMTAPNIYQDVNGMYRGRDLEIHHVDFNYYTVFSLWDTYRAMHPFMTLFSEQMTNDFINTFIKQWEQGGLLPVWELSSCETNCMIGYHAISVIVDAYMKGIRSYDIKKAYQAMKSSAMNDKFGLKSYKSNGYVPADVEGESVSKTLEYAYDDWCIAMMAKELEELNDYEYYIRRAQSYKNVFDPETKFMRARYSGKWFSPFDPREVNFNYTEANAWQYNFYVPQDINTLIQLHGGDEAFCEMLDKMFTESTTTTGREQADITGLIGQYAHGNEPSHHIAYLYNCAGKPWKTQALTRQIMKDMYSPTPDGLCGNEDCGQMSAWYVLSSMGFYPVTPGDNQYNIGSPLFSKISFQMENGNTFVVEARNNSDKNVYIQSATLNGKDYNKGYITHDDIRNGGKLIFVMGDKPNENFATERPVSQITDHLIIPSPFVEKGERTFLDDATIAFGCIEPDVKIYYGTKSQFDASFKLYQEPFSITDSVTYYVIAKKGDKESKMIKTSFSIIPKNRTIKLESEYANQYSAGGDNALIDQIRGGENFRTGNWQGFQGQDLVAVVDLHQKETISYLSLGCIQDQRAWIIMPKQVEFFLSEDGENFRSVGVIKHNIPMKMQDIVIHDFELKLKPQQTRYIKVVASSVGKLPEWHLGAGDNGWIFADEFTIK
ncbi:MAG: GH92 family glycosyl hydrolase [Bacteroidales bacterium]|nr:GH92 family glycosyl hydrolase [Bacteroidales bacterium]